MDLRIVNTCNNNCLYCLEQSLRIKEKFIKKEKIFFLLDGEKNKNNITFYGGNPLLHPDILEIVNYCKKNGYKNIGLLTNTFGLNKEFLNNLIYSGLNNIGFYFNSFNKDKHNLIVDGGIKFSELLKNIKLISETNIFFKAIIHINNLNIKLLSNDLIVLGKKYLVNNIDFVNYFPFDRPYDNKDFLEYDIKKNKDNIISLFKIIKSLNLKAKFVKFSKDFFGIFIEFYDFNNGIIKQIGKEDIKRLSGDKITFCFIEKRCNGCFLKDNCKINGL